MIEQKEEREKHKGGRPRKGEIAESKKPKEKEKGRKSKAMNEFMEKMSDKYANDRIVMVCDNALWHKSQYTKIPKNITMTFIPPYTPEMNPIEQVWREIRTKGFHNRYFKTIKEVEEQVQKTIAELRAETIQSITQRDWMSNCIKLETN
jgi:putative transposase